VWDVVSNQEAVKIVFTAPNKEKAGERLVKYAMREWKRKRSGIAMDDMSVICLFFNQMQATKVVD
jgi:serine/threonine protein phosphatase PrpC